MSKPGILCRLGLHRWGASPITHKHRTCKRCGWSVWRRGYGD